MDRRPEKKTLSFERYTSQTGKQLQAYLPVYCIDYDSIGFCAALSWEAEGKKKK